MRNGRQSARKLWFACCILVPCAACLHAVAGPAPVAYRARITGVDDRALVRALEGQSQTIRLRNSPPSTPGQLRRRVSDDVPRLEAVLYSRGHHRGRVEHHISTDTDPVRVTFDVNPGVVYTLGKIQIEIVGEPEDDRPPPSVSPRLQRGQPAAARPVLGEGERILWELQRQGYPKPSLVERRVHIQDERSRVDVTYVVDPGPYALFGEVSISGLRKVEDHYVSRRVGWQMGEPFDAQELRDFEQVLLTSGLFSTARARAEGEPDEDGLLPVAVRLTERRHRTVRMGAGYRSDVGFGGRVSWEHRNLLGGGERLETAFTGSGIEWGGRAVFRRPDFLTRHLAFVYDLEAVDERPDAYTSRRLKTGVSLEHEFTRQSIASMGLAYKYSEVDQLDAEEYYGLVSTPLQFDRDARDDRLDPVRGWQVILKGTPFTDTKSDLSFLKGYAEARFYRLLLQQARVVAALRAAVGSISGASRENIPADERFYAGGGGSVRGYEYQTIGEVVDDTPLGGNAVVIASMELRSTPFKNLGGVLFVDGGSVSESSVPGENTSMQWAAGFGLRYDVGFAPLRVDVAFPTDKRDIDEDFQFYISIGQAF